MGYTHDLRQLFRTVGSGPSGRALEAAPVEREDRGEATEVLDDPARVEAAAVEQPVYVDGIQAALVLTHREHRPVYLSYVAAGAVDRDGRPQDVEETLKLVSSHLDRPWLDDTGTTVPTHPLSAELPPDVERAAHHQLGGDRADHERTVVSRALTRDRFVVVDGSLTGRHDSDMLGGVIKTHMTKYLPDERVLYGLPAGWRSPRFKIPAGKGSSADRWSCYVRLHPADNRQWTFGLVRVETFRLDLLEPLAALAIKERQRTSAGDARYDRHLLPVRRCEELLRSRRPQVF